MALVMSLALMSWHYLNAGEVTQHLESWLYPWLDHPFALWPTSINTARPSAVDKIWYTAGVHIRYSWVVLAFGVP